jgi:tetratricopeptide (TPR) repeat protein
MNTKVISLCFLIILSGNLCAAYELEKGSYNVHFTSYEVYDASRQYMLGQDTISRPMLIHFWYPAQETSQDQHLYFKNYIDLISLRENFRRPTTEVSESSFNFVNAYSEFAKRQYGLDSSISTQQLLDCPVSAKIGLANIYNAGDLPLIIYAPSNSKSSVQNHMICEFLASHGFMILSVGSAGPTSLQREQMQESILSQVEDMEFILRYFEETLNMGFTSLGLMGFSSGALATTIFQMRNEKVGAVFSMDGGNEYGAYPALFQLKDFDLERTNVPYCLAVNNYENFSIYPYFNSILTKDKHMFRMPYLDHNGFVSYWRFFDSCSSGPDESKMSLSYDYLCECALEFYNTYLGTDQSMNADSKFIFKANSFIQPVNQNNAAVAELCNLVSGDQPDLATRRLNETQALYADKENEINILGRMFIDNHIDFALELFLFNVDKHPDSWQAYYNLGNAYKVKGEFTESKNALLKALALNPENPDIAALLDAL